ncbi:MAG: electron transporter [Gammaproteobacteria bacterium]|nr:MAG: electron transporter [Gammaproteobacteria bacterium]
MDRQHKTRLALIAALLPLVLLVVAYLNFRELPVGEKYRPLSEYGGDFALFGYDRDYTLDDFKGKVLVMYFGFLNCTEACPQSMTKMRTAFNRLSEAELAQVLGVFVSVDPERDKREDLKGFAEYYHKNVVALTGTQEQVDKITSDYGVFFELVDLEGSALGYTVDHASRFYLVDKSGKLYTTMSHSTTPNELAARIRQVLEKPEAQEQQTEAVPNS